MAIASLAAELRTETGKGAARKLRAVGRVPAVIYGHNRDAQALSVNARELGRLLERIAAGSTVVELGFGSGSARTLIREIQRHPVKRSFVHVDFQELVAGEKVTVGCPLVFVGSAMGTVGPPWTVDGIAPNSPSGAAGGSSNALLVQAMASFGASGSESLNPTPLADTTQQPLVTTPQHA